MAKGLREINTRIKSVKSTAQITKAMQLVASSKMRRAQDSAVAGRNYGWLLADLLDSALRTRDSHCEHPLVRKREPLVRGILLISTDKGLCGALNPNLFRLLKDVPPNTHFVAIGRKGAQHIARTGRTLLANFTIPDNVSFSGVRVISDYLLKNYCEGRIDTLEILYPRFRNTLIQEPVLYPILPIEDIHAAIVATRAQGGPEQQADTPDDRRTMHFEPDSKAIFAELPSLYCRHAIYHAMLEAKASEHSARMVAMKAATDNARQITENLTLEYNKARQAAITQEINEITAAALAK
ncbi:MAG: ATP synthase F1 subunit gamma [Puniceicoccales bacterium]|jgi:F-type H+-transporting ATPase subunit gamma|nr:ATP synthase F1 subunit gamma [Puniceicoccales bacterium]